MNAEEILVRDIRAIAISSNQGILLRRIRKDLDEVGVDSSSHRALGFKSIEDFISSRPDEFTVHNGIVRAVEKEESAHISKLVALQRRRKLPPARSDRSKNNFNERRYSRGGGPASSSQRPPRFRENLPPKFSQKPFQYEQDRVVAEPLRQPRGGQTRKNDYREREPEMTVSVPNGISHDGGRADSARRKVIVRPPLLTEVDIPVATFRAKEPVSRQPYRHRLSEEDESKVDRKVLSRLGPRHEPIQTALPQSQNKPLAKSVSWESEKITKEPAYVPTIASNYSSLPSKSLVGVPLSYPSFPTKSPVNAPPSYPSFPAKSPVNAPASYSSFPAKSPVDAPPILPNCPSLPGKNPAAARLNRFKQNISEQQTDLADQTQRQISEDDISCKLKDHCIRAGLAEPEVQQMPVQTAAGEISHTCIVKIGNKHFSAQADDAKLAHNIATSKALFEVSSYPSVEVESYSDIPSANHGATFDTDTDSDKARFLLLIQKLVDNGGVWLDCIPEKYFEAFKTPVPSTYVSLIENCPRLSVTTSFSKKIVNKALPLNVEDVDVIAPAPLTETKCPLESPALLSMSLQTDKSAESVQLPELQFPDDKFWELYIVQTVGVSQVICRLLGPNYSEQYDDMMDDLEMNMLSGGVEATSPKVGEFYLVSVDDQWVRVQVKDLLPDGQVSILCIDYGAEEQMCAKELYELNNKYRHVAPQAFRLLLRGLECFPTSADAIEVGLRYLSKVCIGEVSQNRQDFIDSNYVASAVLWDTTGDDDVNINLSMMEEVVAKFSGPSLTVGDTREILLSHTSEKGLVYLTPAGSSLACISSLIDTLVDTVPPINVDKVRYNGLYLAKNPLTKRYQRAKVLATDTTSRSVTVFFVDYGHEVDVSNGDLLDLSTISDKLCSVPPLAAAVKLAGVNKPGRVLATRLHNIVLPTDILIARVTDRGEDGLMSVELYKRNPDTLLQSINGQLKAPEEIVPEQLPCPNLREVFPVSVTLAATPGHFCVRPANMADEIRDLMTTLQQEMSEPGRQAKDLKIGGIYAVFHMDSWYRARLMALLGSGMVNMELCDFGILVVLTSSNVRPLPVSCAALPLLGFKARLAGVTPKNGDWTPQDCVLFQELVQDKDLASIVWGIEQEADNVRLVLELIDTSGNQDEFIHHILVDKGSVAYKREHEP